MIGEIISAVGDLAGGYLNNEAAAKNVAMQKEFAKHGIRWKVADAKAAGVHPLAALGASTTSFSPVSVGGGLGDALSKMGQDVGRAVNATQTAPERATATAAAASKLQLDNMALQNQLLASRVKLLNQAGGNPPLPTSGDTFTTPEGKAAGRPQLGIGGERIKTDAGTANADEFEKRYGDSEVASTAVGASVMFHDLVRNYGKPQTWPKQVLMKVWNELSNDVKNEYGNAKRFISKITDERAW